MYIKITTIDITCSFSSALKGFTTSLLQYKKEDNDKLVIVHLINRDLE